MKHYKMILSYDGSRYNGWQRQGNTGRTIQGKLETVLSKLNEAEVEIRGAGRTDAGVHARGQCADFYLTKALPPEEVLNYLNRYLPEDVAVISCSMAEPRFHARLSAKGKRYIYRLWISTIPNVFQRKYVTTWLPPLDLAAMKQGASLLIGTHDFKAFCGNRRFKKSSVRTLSTLDVRQLGDEVRLIFEGNGFLYHMVRILAGTLVEVGEGKRDVASLPAVLDSRDRLLAGPALPAQGLILDEVFY